MYYLIEGSNFLVWGGGKGLIHINKLQERKKDDSFLMVSWLIFTFLGSVSYFNLSSELKKAVLDSFNSNNLLN